jgi:hypothetical protein
MTLAVPVIRNEQKHSLSLDLGVTTDNALSLDSCRVRALHSFELKLVQMNIQRIAQDWQQASYEMTNIIIKTRDASVPRVRRGNAPVAAGCPTWREHGKRTHSTGTD